MSFRPVLRALPLACALSPCCLAPATAQTLATAPSYAPADAAYPGAIELAVDATDIAHRIFRVQQRIPVQSGPLTLLFPKWLPGKHADYGRVEKLAGLVITGNGQRIAWQRDPLDVFAFRLDVPAGVTTLDVAFQYLSPTDPSQGRIVMAPAMLNLQWETVALYPAGYAADRISFVPSVKLPAGWQAATALDGASRSGDTIRYAPVDFETLVDSPMFAGAHAKVFELDPGADEPVRLNVFADDARFLEAKPEHLAMHRALVDEAYALFGAQHYDHYDFLFALTGQMGGIGLEHHRSSENALGTDYFTGWDPKKGSSDLLGHEFVHSWNGKFRRGADLVTPHYNTPMQGSLLWVYEGQTQYWGQVLTARAGLKTAEQARDALALTAAAYADNRPGLEWRTLADTTNDPIIAQRRPKPYRGWQLSEDYYSGAQLMWLEADARIRAKSGGRKSLDDFARAFFGVGDGSREVQPYVFDDVVAALDGVVEDDWATFLRDRLDGHAPLTGGLEAAGWKLVYKDEPNAYAKAAAAEWGGADFVYSLGFGVTKEGLVGDVRWDSPAFAAGIAPGMTPVAVNGRAYTAELLEDAIKAAKDGGAPIELLVKDFDRYRTLRLDYRGGLRYPHLERIEGSPDRLSKILAAKR